MGLTILPILFVMAMQVILYSPPGVVQGPRLRKRIKKLLLKAFMDDTAMAVSTEQHAYAMLFRLDEVVRWCSMDFKSEKSRSLSIMKGKPGTISFSVAKPHDPRGIRRTG